VVATSDHNDDDAIETLCRKMEVDCFRGSLGNVLDRFYKAALKYQTSTILRLTGDCPLTDPEKLDDLIQFFRQRDLDYASNCIPPTLPDGLDAEIFTMNALTKAWNNAVLPSEKEHVTPYLLDEQNQFKVDCKIYKEDRSGLRWCVDHIEDFKLVSKIYETLYPTNPEFTTQDILSLMDKNPQLAAINNTIQRNEGELAALEKDRLFLAGKKNS